MLIQLIDDSYYNVSLTSAEKLNKIWPEFYNMSTHSVRRLENLREQVLAAVSICITTIRFAGGVNGCANRTITHAIHYY